jgi:hypothetical protein
MVKTLAALLLSGSTLAVAAPFSVTRTDTVAPLSQAPYIPGQSLSVTFVLDNGGTSAASQTWNAVDVVSVTYVLNNGAITTVFDPNGGDGMSDTLGSFVTDWTGALTAVPTHWADDSGTVPIISSNDPAGSTAIWWWVNANNSIYYNIDGGNLSAEATNVANNINPAFWSDLSRKVHQQHPPQSQPCPSTRSP